EIVFENRPINILVYIDVRRNNIVIMTFVKNWRKNEKFLQEVEPLKPVVIFIRRPDLKGLFSRPGDSGAPIFSYSSDLQTVSLAGILLGGTTATGGDEFTSGVSATEILER
ncbi:10559_t:CDS:2, partial [Racocetra persica]